MRYDDFLQLVRERRSTRIFKPDPVPDDYIDKILEAGRWAMSGGNGQPWEFIVVKDQDMRRKIVDFFASTRQDGVDLEMRIREDLRLAWTDMAKGPPGFRDAPAIIVLLGDMRAILASVVRVHLFSGDKVLQMNLANSAMLMHLAAASLGLGSEWVSINPPYESELRALLGVPRYYTIRLIIPVGYPARKPGPGVRRELDEIVHREKYDMSKYRSIEDIHRFIAGLRKQTKPAYPVVPTGAENRQRARLQ